ncbi:MAG: hypothetical protein WD467_02795 [Candidatus Saccharimonadales bacterium]
MKSLFQKAKTNQGLDAALDNLRDFLQSEKEYLAMVSKDTIKTCNRLHESWSGSWAGYHANLYFKEYEVPNTSQMFDPEWGGAGVFNDGYDPGWQTKTLDEMWQHIISNASKRFDIDEANDKLEALKELMRNLKIQLELVIGNDVLKKKIDDIDVDFSIGDYIKARSPSQVVSRDSKAIYQGMQVPPHIECQGFGKAIELNLKSANELIKLAELQKNQPRNITKNDVNVWHYTNPFWLVATGTKKIYRFMENHKVKSLFGALIAVAGLLAIDYSLAWSNTKSIINFFRDLV